MPAPCASTNGLINRQKPPHCGAVPKSKASAHPPIEPVKASPPSAPGRFSGARKPRLLNEPTTAHYAVRGAWVCHTGRVRQYNEDSLLAGSKIFGGSSETPAKIAIEAGPWLVAVSDGIGGHRGGAEASRQVIEALAACDRITPVAVAETLQKLNRDFCERGHKDTDFMAMGATVAGIGCGMRGLFAFNVGDSRVYQQEGDKLIQITRDDSEAEDLIDLGFLQPYDGPRPGFLHALTQAVGGREEVLEIDTHVHPLEVDHRTRFLICSDGLTDMLHTPEIREILATEKGAELAARALFEGAMSAGGTDNITLAVVEVEKI